MTTAIYTTTCRYTYKAAFYVTIDLDNHLMVIGHATTRDKYYVVKTLEDARAIFYKYYRGNFYLQYGTDLLGVAIDVTVDP